jgi:L-2-hydroxyglutarate oxidase LhgO
LARPLGSFGPGTSGGRFGREAAHEETDSDEDGNVTTDYDVAVIGGGIVGLATATAVARAFPGVRLCVIDKETAFGRHQTGHNSGVLHTGLYYAPGSLKAELCVRGHRMMGEFCDDESIPIERRGKVVVATSEPERARLAELHRRGTENGLRGLRRLTPAELTEIEPEATGLEALHVPDAAVVDFAAVARRLGERLPGDVLLGEPVERIEVGDGARVHRTGSSVSAGLVVNCAGLHADRVARLAGLEPPARIVPFRGEYYELAPHARDLVRTLIYPVPDPAFPFLGVHFTRRVDDSVEVGPNAVLSLGREFYRGTRPNLGDLRETLAYGGFRSLARRYWRTGAAEMWRSSSRRVYARTARALVPRVTGADLRPAGAGVRAQAVTADGRLVDDFLIEESPHCLHVLNAPSPAATASLAIGEHLAGRVGAALGSRA